MEPTNCDCICVAGKISEQQNFWSAPPGRSCLALNSTSTNKTSCSVQGHAAQSHHDTTQAPIKVTKASIGCLDIQTEGNMTSIVGQACEGKMTCSYKAPTEDE